MSNPTFQDLTPSDFMHSFGADESTLPCIAEEAAKYDFRYRRMQQSERDAVILDIIKGIGSFTQVGAHRHNIWESCWEDVAARYMESGGKLSALEPHFIGAAGIVRMNGDYALPHSPGYDLNWFKVLRAWLFHTYVKGRSAAYEFGCGSGYNLAELALINPDIKLVGLDWSEKAVALINHFAAEHKMHLSGRRFDFFHPDHSIKLEPDCAVMTFAALEQVGDSCSTFVDWLIEQRPGIVVSMEPVAEFYNPDQLFDHLALTYHRTRKYLDGYYTRLVDLAKQGKVEIIKTRRLNFGSLYQESFSLLIWRPL